MYYESCFVLIVKDDKKSQQSELADENLIRSLKSSDQFYVLMPVTLV